MQAQRVRRAAQRALAETFRDVDVIAMPTFTRAALSYRELDERGLMAVYAEANTAYWDGVGNPALALPMGMSEGGLPLSMQLAGRPFEEVTVLRVGHTFRSTTSDWHRATPDPIATAPSTGDSAHY